MKKPIFTKNINLLITAVVIIAAIFGKKSGLFMLIAIIIWTFYISIKPISNVVKYMIKKISQKIQSLIQKMLVFAIPKSTPNSEPEERIGDSLLNQEEEKTMQHHIELRITDKLKQIYPEARWNWEVVPTLKELLSSNKKMRITVEGMEKYTHADIQFDAYKRIHIEPMIIGSFTKPKEGEEPIKEWNQDITTWYELYAQEILNKVITELNASGYSKLAIKENGDIVIWKHKKEVIQTTLKDFPKENNWKTLIEILKKEQLKANINNNQLNIDWV